MTAKDFLAWMEQTGHASGADITRSLGLGRNQAQTLVARARAGEDVQIKPAIALAMTAIANGLRPWDHYDR
ncbi:MAG: hypothetical protein MRY67_14520 [Rhodovulum sp.]|jgi:DNA-binding transcriptional regulator LsrR (DeoR family)|uniref:hypothetical protein n=1 Tax=Rhodovulum sp. FJ3 TaxID=3079053 RepID=UPI00293DB3D4|nr:hypothetical protein [Rhodovulum sp. FJ3]MCI5087132.1 hypothetical protein [Rhodovulum sp.]MDV4166951.1 hypothetical protein [Rhodovulum sp. FJ3]